MTETPKKVIHIPDKIRGVRRVVSFLTLYILGITATTILHELIHVATIVLLTGRTGVCPNGIPFSIQGPMIWTCVPPGMFRGFDLAAPLLTGAAGLGLIWYGGRTNRFWCFAVGIVTWVVNASYSVGLGSNTADLNQALAIYGPVSFLPGFLLIVLGIPVIVCRSGDWDEHLSFSP